MTSAEKYLKDNLLPEEKVLWSGKPTNVKPFEKPFGTGIIIRFVISVLLIIFAIWYWPYAMSHNFETSMPITMTIIMLAISAFICISPFYNARRLPRRCLYAITNQRALIVYNVNPAIARSRELSAVMGSSYETLATGCGTIYIGEKVKGAARKARDFSLIPDMPDEGMPLMFYSVENPAAVFATLTQCEGGEESAEIASA